eukprot:TRINITY_DN1828_c0_g5_i1.p1 TRINITY_DN1828_c0_g5~~TRINITY_DN1828_c0_g5_i1.p1  ORF type:complete len:582 (-),score=175.07 TRINITY_DN1828_c0_g5_i1:15-1760(-)
MGADKEQKKKEKEEKERLKKEEKERKKRQKKGLPETEPQVNDEDNEENDNQGASSDVEATFSQSEPQPSGGDPIAIQVPTARYTPLLATPISLSTPKEVFADKKKVKKDDFEALQSGSKELTDLLKQERDVTCSLQNLILKLDHQVQGALEELKTRRQMEAEDDETEVYVIPANTWRAQVQFVYEMLNEFFKSNPTLESRRQTMEKDPELDEHLAVVLEADLDEVQKYAEDIEVENDQLKQSEEEKRATIDEQKTTITDLQENVDRTMADLLENRQSLLEIEEQNNALKDEKISLEARLEEVTAEIESKKAEIEELQAAPSPPTSQAVDAPLQSGGILAIDLEQSRIENRRMRIKIEELEGEIAHLRERQGADSLTSLPGARSQQPPPPSVPLQTELRELAVELGRSQQSAENAKLEAATLKGELKSAEAEILRLRHILEDTQPVFALVERLKAENAALADNIHDLTIQNERQAFTLSQNIAQEEMKSSRGPGASQNDTIYDDLRRRNHDLEDSVTQNKDVISGLQSRLDRLLDQQKSQQDINSQSQFNPEMSRMHDENKRLKIRLAGYTALSDLERSRQW